MIEGEFDAYVRSDLDAGLSCRPSAAQTCGIATHWEPLERAAARAHGGQCATARSGAARRRAESAQVDGRELDE